MVGNRAFLAGIGKVQGDLLAESGATIRSEMLRVGGDYRQEIGETLTLQIAGELFYNRLFVGG
jgi:hypothetical protein